MSVTHLTLRRRLRERGLDGVTLLVLPGVLFVLALFIYPFVYGLILSFEPKQGGGWLANYQKFFSEPFLYETIWLTLQIAVPATLLNTVLSVPVALRVRLMKRQKLLTTILVIPITLGTVMVADGLLTYLGPRGWLNRILLEFGLTDWPLRLIHNYWGVMLSLVISGFPFTFLLTLSYVTGIDPALEQAGAMLGAQVTPAVLPHPAAAAGTWAGYHVGAGVRAGVHRVSLGHSAGCTGRAHAGDLHCRVSGGVRAVRLPAGLGDRDADGADPGGDHCRPAGRAQLGVPRSGQHGQGLRRHASQSWREAVVVHRLGGGGVLRAQPAGDDRQRCGEFVRHALVQHLAAGRLHAAVVRDGLGRVPVAADPGGDGRGGGRCRVASPG